MNIYDMMKQLKGLQKGFEEVKESLRLRKEIVERDGVEIVFNGLGEILSIEVKDVSLKQDWERVKPVLLDLINEAQRKSRDMAKEEFRKRFGGLLGGLGFGL
ncbi:MAG: YbaB/EbfC family nucleoid-associated protein [Aquificota bacterium]|nr:YbaB/EbfC family nucleoid-associated protein [Aquificota bacterium]